MQNFLWKDNLRNIWVVLRYLSNSNSIKKVHSYTFPFLVCSLQFIPLSCFYSKSMSKVFYFFVNHRERQWMLLLSFSCVLFVFFYDTWPFSIFCLLFYWLFVRKYFYVVICFDRCGYDLQFSFFLAFVSFFAEICCYSLKFPFKVWNR